MASMAMSSSYHCCCPPYTGLVSNSSCKNELALFKQSSGNRPLKLRGLISGQRRRSVVNDIVNIRATKQAKTPAEEDWKIKREYLLQNQVKSVSAKEAYRLQNKDGYVLLDVRREGEFEQIHPEGAVNVQVYRLIKEWTAWDIARRAAFAFFGIFEGTEENPDFLNEVNTKIGKDKKIIVACSAGGTMKPSANLAEGQQSRSLIAAYLLKLGGYKTVVHLEGGLRSWFKDEGLPTTSSE